MSEGAFCPVIPLPPRATRVLCIYRYWVRDGGKTRELTDSVMVRAYSSDDVMGAFKRAMILKGGPELARGYRFVGYVPENGRRTW